MIMMMMMMIIIIMIMIIMIMILLFRRRLSAEGAKPESNNRWKSDLGHVCGYKFINQLSNKEPQEPVQGCSCTQYTLHIHSHTHIYKHTHSHYLSFVPVPSHSFVSHEILFTLAHTRIFFVSYNILLYIPTCTSQYHTYSRIPL